MKGNRTIADLRYWEKDIISPSTLIFAKSVYGRTCIDGDLTKKLGIFALLYVHFVDYSTTFEVF